MSPDIAELLGSVRVIPVLTIQNAGDAVPLARALVRGGLNVLEVTFRTAAAQEAIRRIVGEVPEAIVGAGTVTLPHHFAEAAADGARFAVSPGATPHLLAAAKDSPLAYLPAAATASEAMTLAEHGFAHQKFFPASAAGGVEALRQLAAPLPLIHFCPTGGLDQGNAAEYLACRNVFAVGGSWPAPASLIAAQDWDGIVALARAAASL
ncbi:MAG: bifunctional 4-hydroxy-2-oxoglutarate aldolase/2-dehydro-3-deoxy-phosphogluconate aldolase [Alphaproteobacteria bacterium]|nr:bifunctional 4-hydroxy-2-oxoglutarate aldolase/2-dehydro-3-deoxy-phosphogluconate aldolase [Alphaproteobacteria bacterium]MCB9930490.1 bifunctional 4-hydroxy-2-oxoglutarate aldolase/2-dehydro-3-deoxy-phosphogluconate aldolase [Alphaproteobacteria bacterium]